MWHSKIELCHHEKTDSKLTLAQTEITRPSLQQLTPRIFKSSEHLWMLHLFRGSCLRPV